jgi:site-specific recombinase XerD
VQRVNHLIGTAPGKRRVLVARHNGFVFLAEDELLSVLRTAKSKSIRDWAMILTTYSHGLRAAESCALKITDLDMRGGVLSIRRLKGSLFTIQELEKHRGIPLLDEVKALKEWLAIRPTDCGDALFTSQKGSHLSSTQFYRRFRQIARQAGLPDHKGHPHVLKHTLATHMVRRDVNLAKVQRALGHRSINSTMLYVGVSDQEADSARHNALMNAF